MVCLVSVQCKSKAILQQLQLILVSSIGGSCVRMTTAFGVLSNLDDTELLTPLVIWTQVEPSLSIIVSCGMLLRPVLNKILPKRLLSSRRTRDGDNAAKRYNIIDGTGQRRTPRDWTEDSTLVKPSATYSLHERDAPPNR